MNELYWPEAPFERVAHEEGVVLTPASALTIKWVRAYL